MGQSQSIEQDFSNFFSHLVSEEPINTLLSEEIHSLSYEQFLVLLKELNIMSRKCLDSEGRQLVFAVRKGTDVTPLWKALVHIACVKIDPITQKVDTFRFLTLSEFLKVVKTFKCQSSAAEQSKSEEYFGGSSQAPDNTDNINNPISEENLNECIICFERKQEILLPCAHGYCMKCIEEWGEDHDTCPVCRAHIGRSEDSWVLSEVPKSEEIEDEIKASLMELIDHRSSPCSPS